ncbi:Serine/arginine-rich SC35-like splicing factor SCL30-like protein [Drosera capensis]
MRRYSPGYYSPPRREYGGRGRSPPRGGYSPPRRGYSPPRRGYGGDGYGRRKEQGNGSLLVRNIPLDCRPEELRVPFERFGMVRDVYIPKDYYTGEPRGFAFVQFVDSYDASQAQYHMNRQIFAGREISVVVAADTRKRPEEMRRKTRGPPRHGGRRSPYDRRSRSRSVSRSPRHRSGSGAGYRSRSYSPSPRQRNDAERRRSSKDSARDRDGNRSYSPGYDTTVADGRDAANGKSKYSSKDARDHRKSSPRSPSLSRSAPPDASPARSG